MDEYQVKKAGDPVVNQPSQTTDAENYVLNLDHEDVKTWSPQQVADQFLANIGLGYLGEQFVMNKIGGNVLANLNESHLKEMGVSVLGDRIFLLEMVSYLKRKKIDVARSQALWTGQTPAPGCPYKRNCCELCCPEFFYGPTRWRVTGQGIFYKDEPSCCFCCGTVNQEYIDYRFLKDLELKESRFCCCWRAKILEIYSEDKDSGASHRPEEGLAPDGAFAPHILKHPEANKVEKIIRNAWTQARLVAD